MASSGAEAAERAHIDVKHRHVLPPSRRDGGATQIGSKRAFQIKLGYGLTSSRASTTFAVTRAGLILHPPTRPNFHPYGWAAGPCQLGWSLCSHFSPPLLGYM